MGETLYPYLFAMLVTVSVLVAGWFAFVSHRKAAIDHQLKAQRIPDFVRYVQLNEEIVGLEEKRERLRQHLGQAEATVQEAMEARLFLEQNADVIQQSRQSREQLQETESKLVGLQEQLGILTEQQRKATEELARATFEREEQSRRAERLANDQTELQKDNETLRERTVSLEARKQELLEESASLIERSGGLRAEVAGLDARKSQLEAELETLSQQTTEARMTVKSLAAETQTLEGTRARIQGELGPDTPREESEKLEDLREPLLTQTEWSTPRMADDEHESIELVSQHLKNLDLKFSSRVLRAFHTALKVQGEAPLLVLAGISGTGKSLLPQKYAEAMGIHCHVVPVQPRWDGPQDLLGFYHHLEQRFKATPLTRGLVQFDRFGNIHEEDLNLSDRMLLVVLDEMNLARVEYYFSEFLSRLETRRDVDIEDAIARARAAVQLELGQNQTYNLTVDRNVLFVGTINEDESTQSLSDKVVDRANVMRFGRPSQLAKPASAGALHDTSTAKGYLPRTVWQGWLENANTLDDASLLLAQQTATDLNEAMSGIGRAFGHRTFRAMLAYVQQYPLRTSQGLHEALADQVEQRILPKLRGLDPTEQSAGRTIRDVREIVHRLGDEELELAIEQASKGHSFLWQGIDRRD